jgi:soluble lytic murein transglycosylase-like protein
MLTFFIWAFMALRFILAPAVDMEPMLSVGALPHSEPPTARVVELLGAPANPAPDTLDAIAARHFGPNADAALRVAWCESRYDPFAVGAAGERGIFQIHPVHIGNLARLGLSWDAMFDAEANATYAAYLSRGGTDWSHWTCKP